MYSLLQSDLWKLVNSSWSEKEPICPMSFSDGNEYAPMRLFSGSSGIENVTWYVLSIKNHMINSIAIIRAAWSTPLLNLKPSNHVSWTIALLGALCADWNYPTALLISSKGNLWSREEVFLRQFDLACTTPCLRSTI